MVNKQIYNIFLWIKHQTLWSSLSTGADPNIWVAATVFNLPIHLREWKSTKKEMLVLRRMTGQDTELPRRLGHTHHRKVCIRNSWPHTAQSVCVCVCVCVCGWVWGGITPIPSKKDRPVAPWVSPGRCSSSSRKHQEICEIRKKNFSRCLRELLVQLVHWVWKTTWSIILVWNVRGARGEAPLCKPHPHGGRINAKVEVNKEGSQRSAPS